MATKRKITCDTFCGMVIANDCVGLRLSVTLTIAP